MTKTIVWGVCADGVGIIRQYSDEIHQLPGGGARVETRTRLDHEPASSYSSVHPWPMPMNYEHTEPIGAIVALRRAHTNLYAVGECDLDPNELSAIAADTGLRWSTGTDTVYGAPLRIVEISLVREPATVGLPPVSWYKLGVTKGNPPDWVRAELDRASSKVEHRSRRSGEVLVHEVGETAISPPADDYEHRRVLDGLEIEYSRHPGRILAVNGRPVRAEGS